MSAPRSIPFKVVRPFKHVVSFRVSGRTLTRIERELRQRRVGLSEYLRAVVVHTCSSGRIEQHNTNPSTVTWTWESQR